MTQSNQLTWIEPTRPLTWSLPSVSTSYPLEGDMTLPSTINLTKRPTESAVYNYDFANDPVILGGATISSVTSVVATLTDSFPTDSDPVATLTLGTPTHVGTIVSVLISGGAEGDQYSVVFTILTSGSYTRVGLGQLSVED